MNPPVPDDSLPHVLLAEDDPVSAAFLQEALAALPARVQLARDVADAKAAAHAAGFDLLLLDANLPGGSGVALLQALRAQGIATPALAHTADPAPEIHASLRAAGFLAVLHKPIQVAALHAALRQHLPQQPRQRWDDAAALRALGGQQAHVASLRALFLSELPGQRQRIVQAATRAEVQALRDELHRLSASCGFVGASRLGAAVHALQEHLLDPAALRDLEAAINELLAA